MSGTAASTQSESGEAASPSTQITARIASPERKLFAAHHPSSAATMSSSATGALRIASHVFCTCMRENDEYSASKVAVFMIEKQTVPAARKAM